MFRVRIHTYLAGLSALYSDDYNQLCEVHTSEVALEQKYLRLGFTADSFYIAFVKFERFFIGFIKKKNPKKTPIE